MEGEFYMVLVCFWGKKIVFGLDGIFVRVVVIVVF